MKVEVSARQEATDGTIHFVLPFVDAREAINVTNTDTNEQIMEGTLINTNIINHETGFNFL
jgi:hypothetical protein